jgi:predicted transcriptional regulator
MDELNMRGSKHMRLSISDSQRLCNVSKALSNPVRLQIMQLLGKRAMQSVNEMAECLDLPVSTVALAIRTLEDAGLIFTENMPGIHGTLKLSTRKVDSLSIDLLPYEEHTGSVLVMRMPVGCYSKVGNILPTCGLAGANNTIGEDDNPRTFYHSDRFSAQLLWFRQGFVEYLFTVININEIDINWLELSFEACSEAPMYRDPWKSDITVSINGRLLGTWTSPCDCGEHRGRLNPAWWSDLSTQHGFLKTWRVDANGSYLDSLAISGTSLSDLMLSANDAIVVRIEVPADAENVGGLNLFGEQFGDFPQDLVLQVGYRMKEAIPIKL